MAEALSTNLFCVMQCDVSALLLPDSESGELRVMILYDPDSRGPMREGFLWMSRCLFTDSTVMILGETGTGKELIARATHGGKRTGLRGAYRKLRSNAPTIADLGLSKKQAFEAQMLATLPEKLFDEVKLGTKTRIQVKREQKAAKQEEDLKPDILQRRHAEMRAKEASKNETHISHILDQARPFAFPRAGRPDRIDGYPADTDNTRSKVESMSTTTTVTRAKHTATRSRTLPANPSANDELYPDGEVPPDLCERCGLRGRTKNGMPGAHDRWEECVEALRECICNTMLPRKLPQVPNPSNSFQQVAGRSGRMTACPVCVVICMSCLSSACSRLEHRMPAWCSAPRSLTGPNEIRSNSPRISASKRII